MISKYHMIRDNILAFLLFFLTWTILQLLLLKGPDSLHFFGELLWMIIFYGFVGIYLPQRIKQKYHFPYNLKRKSPILFLLGLVLLCGVLGIGIFTSGAFSTVAKSNISPSGYIKYVLLFIPMSLAVSFYLFNLFPHTILSFIKQKGIGVIVLFVISALASSLCFAGDTLLGDMELIVIMAIFGALFMGVFILTGSFLLTWLGYFISMYFNTLAEGKYLDYTWYLLIFGFMFSMAMLLIGSRNSIKQTHDNGLYTEKEKEVNH
jgi:hypothetical protein